MILHDDSMTKQGFLRRETVSIVTRVGLAGELSPGPPTVAAMSSSGRDAQRARVYRAEDAWAARLDAARQGAVLATVGGSALLLPAERRLGSLEAAAAYAARVVALPEVVSAFATVPAPALRLRRGVRSAHWEPPGTIALPVPEHGEPWALRETVLLHELAHHLAETTGTARGHRAPYPAVVLLLARAVLGDEAELALRIEYGEHDVEVGGLG
jgi:putative metallohydrolase (TIGR04338 family)